MHNESHISVVTMSYYNSVRTPTVSVGDENGLKTSTLVGHVRTPTVSVGDENSQSL